MLIWNLWKILIRDKNLKTTNLLVKIDLLPSKSQARTLVEQGGISINDIKITDTKHNLTIDDFTNNGIIIKKGKKVFIKVNLI